MCHFPSIAFHHLILVYFEEKTKKQILMIIALLLVVWCSPLAHPTPRCPRWCDKVSHSRHRSQSEQGQVSDEQDLHGTMFKAELKVSYWVSINCQPHDRNSFSMWATLHTYLCQRHYSIEGQYTLCLLKKELKPDKEDFQSFCPKQTPHHPHCFLRRNQNADCKIQLWSICIEFMQGVFLSPPPFTLP